MGKLKYILLMVGTLIGLVLLHENTGHMFWAELAVPLGMLGFGIGGILDKRGVE